MGCNARKPVIGGLRTRKVQTSLRIRADRLASLLFAFWKVSYVNLIQVKFQFSRSETPKTDFLGPYGNAKKLVQHVGYSLLENLIFFGVLNFMVSVFKEKHNNFLCSLFIYRNCTCFPHS